MTATATHPSEAAVIRRLSTLDRFLPLWIALAMAGGLALGSLVPGLNDFLDELKVGTVSLPIALGLLLMMYPVLTKVRYEDMGKMRGDGRMFGVSLFLSWVVGAGAHVRARLAVPRRPARVPHRGHRRRPRALHRDGAGLERPRRRRQRARRHPRRLQRDLPGRRLRAARLVLPQRPARPARPRHPGLRGRHLGGRRAPC